MEKCTYTRLHRLGKYKPNMTGPRIGKFKGMDVYMSGQHDGWGIDRNMTRQDMYLLYSSFDSLFVTFVRDDKVIMELTLAKVKYCNFTDHVFEVEMSRIDCKYQKFGLAPKAYSYLLSRFPNMVIKAGTPQSPGGRSIWHKLAKTTGVVVFGRWQTGPYWELEPDDDLREPRLPHGEIYDRYDRQTHFDMFVTRSIYAQE